MWSAITENLGTLLIGAVLLAVVTAIVTKIVRDKRHGKSISCEGCSGGCANCPSYKAHQIGSGQG